MRGLKRIFGVALACVLVGAQPLCAQINTAARGVSKLSRTTATLPKNIGNAGRNGVTMRVVSRGVPSTARVAAAGSKQVVGRPQAAAVEATRTSPSAAVSAPLSEQVARTVLFRQEQQAAARVKQPQALPKNVAKLDDLFARFFLNTEIIPELLSTWELPQEIKAYLQAKDLLQRQAATPSEAASVLARASADLTAQPYFVVLLRKLEQHPALSARFVQSIGTETLKIGSSDLAKLFS